MFGFGKGRSSASFTQMTDGPRLARYEEAETAVLNFYDGVNPFQEYQEEFPDAYKMLLRGFAYGLDYCRRKNIDDKKRQEVIASMCGYNMARGTFRQQQAA